VCVCPHDHCGKKGPLGDDFRIVKYVGDEVSYLYAICREHAEELGYEDVTDRACLRCGAMGDLRKVDLEAQLYWHVGCPDCNGTGWADGGDQE